MFGGLGVSGADAVNMVDDFEHVIVQFHLRRRVTSVDDGGDESTGGVGRC